MPKFPSLTTILSRLVQENEPPVGDPQETWIDELIRRAFRGWLKCLPGSPPDWEQVRKECAQETPTRG
jgi:hypothetical protein